jgi:CRISPR-associated endonuclease Cas3-HD
MCLETFYAHTLSGHPPFHWEPLEAHLEKVAQSTAAFTDDFQAALWRRALGLCHDPGKRSEDFQRYLNEAGSKSADAGAQDDADAHASSKRVDHSTFGARFLQTSIGGIAGHLLACRHPETSNSNHEAFEAPMGQPEQFGVRSAP